MGGFFFFLFFFLGGGGGGGKGYVAPSQITGLLGGLPPPLPLPLPTPMKSANQTLLLPKIFGSIMRTDLKHW